MPRKNTPTAHFQRSKRRMNGPVLLMTPAVIACPTGKSGFTKLVAEDKLAMYASLSSRRHKVPTRIYQCHACPGWHLTSQEAKSTQTNRGETTT